MKLNLDKNFIQTVRFKYNDLRIYKKGDGIAQSAITFALGSPAELLITDPQGKKLGKDPIANIVYDEIPDSIYTTEGPIVSSDTPLVPEDIDESKVVYIPSPIDGEYDIKVIGTDTGDYTMSLSIYDENGNSKDITKEGQTTTNNIQEFKLDYSAQSVEEIEFQRIVNVDIKPGSEPNSINLKSKGIIPVAVLSDNFFDVKNIMINSIVFTKASPLRGNLEDVDNDGDLDLILHFKTQSLQLSPDDTEAILIGQLKDNNPIKGVDSVRIVK